MRYVGQITDKSYLEAVFEHTHLNVMIPKEKVPERIQTVYELNFLVDKAEYLALSGGRNGN